MKLKDIIITFLAAALLAVFIFNGCNKPVNVPLSNSDSLKGMIAEKEGLILMLESQQQVFDSIIEEVKTNEAKNIALIKSLSKKQKVEKLIVKYGEIDSNSLAQISEDLEVCNTQLNSCNIIRETLSESLAVKDTINAVNKRIIVAQKAVISSTEYKLKDANKKVETSEKKIKRLRVFNKVALTALVLSLSYIYIK